MKLVGIYTNYAKDPGCTYTQLLISNLTDLGVGVVVPEETLCSITQKYPSVKQGDIIEGVDGVVSLGGDGTFLKIARKAYLKGIPILGINLGRLGFLTDIEVNDINGAANCISSGAYRIEERMMLDMAIIRGGKEVARET